MMSTSSGTRLPVIERWWQHLDDLDRERAQYFARTSLRLSRGLFSGLCEAGVLAVDDYYRVLVEAGEAHTFPMPSDIRCYVRQRPLDTGLRVRPDSR